MVVEGDDDDCRHYDAVAVPNDGVPHATVAVGLGLVHLAGDHAADIERYQRLHIHYY